MRALSLSHRRCILLTYFIFTIACVDIPKIIYEQSHIHAWMLTRSLAFNTSPTNHTQTHSTLSPNLCQRGVQGEKKSVHFVPSNNKQRTKDRTHGVRRRVCPAPSKRMLVNRLPLLSPKVSKRWLFCFVGTEFISIGSYIYL